MKYQQILQCYNSALGQFTNTTKKYISTIELEFSERGTKSNLFKVKIKAKIKPNHF